MIGAKGEEVLPPASDPLDAFAQLLATTDAAEHSQLVARAKLMAMNASDPSAFEAYEGADAEGYRVELQSFDGIEAKRTDWLWEGRIPRGMLTLLIGTEGLGKSAACLRLAALASLGLLEGDFKGDPSKVALVTVEDDPERTMRPRLEAAEADLARVHYVRLSKDGKDAGLILPRDAGRLGRTLGEAGVRLVVIDPLASLLDPTLNSYKDTDVRQALEPLLVAAGEHDFAVVGVLHTNKTKTNDARERAMGSVGWRQVVRSALYLGVDPDDPEGKAGAGRAIAHDKCNVGPLRPTVKVALEERRVKVEGESRGYVRAEFGSECDWRANDLLAAEAGVDRDKIGGKDSAAFGLLYELLDDGPKAVAVVREEAEARGIGWRTVEQAKKDIGVRSKRSRKAWVWALPDGLSM